MDLIIPTRHQPTAGSFPTSALQVNQWLSKLYPVTSKNSTRSVVRGIKHFNRLENSITNRFEVLELFCPVIEEIIQCSDEQYSSENLPLDTKELNALNLSNTLLQELLFGYLTIVFLSNERPAPGTVKIYNLSIIKAMDILLKIATRHTQMHEHIPEFVWQNANQLYFICENQNLAQQRLITSSGLDNKLKTAEEFFVCLHLNALIPQFSLASGQIRQLQQYIKESVNKVSVTSFESAEPSSSIKFAVDLNSNAPLTASLFAKCSTPDAMRTLDLSAFAMHISYTLSLTPDIVSTVYESDVLTKNTLMQLLQQIEDKRSRHEARCFCHHQLHLISGLKEACASLKYEFDETIQILTPKIVKGKQKNAYTGNWVQLNRSENGACLQWNLDKPSQVVVGSLAQSQGFFGKNNYWITSVVVWLKVDDAQNLLCGLHHLGKNTEAVQVISTKKTLSEEGAYSECLIAMSLQTGTECLFVPPFTYYMNERVSVSRDNSTDNYKLIKKIESTAAFTCFSIEKV